MTSAACRPGSTRSQTASPALHSAYWCRTALTTRIVTSSSIRCHRCRGDAAARLRRGAGYLDAGSDCRAENPIQVARGRYEKPALTTCPECNAVRTSGQPCPACGWRPRPKAAPIEVADGELAHIDRNKQIRPGDWTPAQRAKFHRELLWIARERGYKPGWAAYQHKQRFGHWPMAWSALPEPPSEATRAWVRSRRIACAKARRAS